MIKSPFKFLDSYTKEDKDIFFGRDREIEEMYQKVFESKILLIYGISGTGKTSIINCGLANKFEDSDWLPMSIRRGTNINDSLNQGIAKLSLLPIKESQPIDKQLHSLYLDHFKPVYIIVDQFEELFIFGDKEEREEFIQTIKQVVDSDVQCRLIFSIREEYLAGVTEFEHTISDFLSNRMRIEKMTWSNASKVIKEPCKAYGIKVEEDLTDTILGKLSPESSDVELTYLQVLLDRFFKLAVEKSEEKPVFSKELFAQIGDVSDLLGSFLEEQVSQLDDPDTGLVILKSFVSTKGTKRQITVEDVSEFAKTLGKKISDEKLKELIIRFVNLRILRDKDESGRYELRHDSLANKIYEKITLVEKDLIEVRQYILDAFSAFKKRDLYLSKKDVEYITPYESKLFLTRETWSFIADSKGKLQITKKRLNRVMNFGFIAIFLILLSSILRIFHLPFGGTFYYLGFFLYIGFFIPFFSYYVIKTKENRTLNLLFLTFSMIFIVTTYLFRKIERKRYAQPIVITEQRTQNTLAYLSSGNEMKYLNINEVVLKNPDKYKSCKILADQIKEQSDEVSNLVQELKLEIVRTLEGDDPEIIEGNIIHIQEINKLDDNNIPSEILIGPDNNGKAYTLKIVLEDYRTYLLDIIDGKDPNVAESIKYLMNTDDYIGKNSDRHEWEYWYFHGLPIGIVINNLSQIQCDIERAEGEVLDYFLEQKNNSEDGN